MHQKRTFGNMMKIAGTITDAWSVFFKEAFIPRTRALRKDIAAISWLPIIVYFILKYLMVFVHDMPLYVTSKTNVNVLDSTKSFNQLLSTVGPVTSAIWSWISILFIIYIACCISSLIIRRLFDTGLSMAVSKSIMILLIIIALYILSPIIIVLINHAQSFFQIASISLPYTSSSFLIAFAIVVYALLQIIPSNMFNSKYYTQSKS